MHFQRSKRKPAATPIVPLIDILFILLIFFIVSTTFKKRRSVLRIELPTVREMTSETVAESRSVLAVSAEGDVTLDSLRVPSGLLDAYLKAFVKENPGRELEMNADRRVTLEKLLEVWDALTNAGIRVKDVPARIRLPANPNDS